MQLIRLLCGLILIIVAANPVNGYGSIQDTLGAARSLTLDQCLEIALENNHLRPVARAALAIAEAQHRQALSGYWPELSMRAIYSSMDEAPETIFPASEITLPPFSLGSIPISLPPLQVSEQRLKLMAPQNLFFSANLIFPLYTGGLRSALHKQADLAIALARQEVKRTDQQVAYDVKRYYFGSVLARNLYEIAKEALIRLEVTLELTENLYKNGTGRVQKTDFLKNKVIVENVRSLVATLKSNESLAQAALVHSLGMDWQSPIQVAGREIPFHPHENNMSRILDSTYRMNPDWVKIKIIKQIMSARIDACRSEYWPKVAVIGGFNHLENSYPYGIVGPANRNIWVVGLSLQLPVFTGFRRLAKVQEAQARLEQLAAQEIMLHKGLAVQIQSIFLRLAAARERESVLKTALAAAVENRDLTERAYQQELKEEEDLIESQIYESMMKAQYQKILYDNLEIQMEMEFIIGTEIARKLESNE